MADFLKRVIPRILRYQICYNTRERRVHRSPKGLSIDFVNEFKISGVKYKFNGIHKFLFWYDSMTFN